MGKWTLGLACAVALAGFLTPLTLRAQVDPNTVNTAAVDTGAVDTAAGTFGGGLVGAAGGFVGGRGLPAGQVPPNLIAGGFGGGGRGGGGGGGPGGGGGGGPGGGMGGGGRGGGGGGGTVTLQTALASPDDEYSVLAPRVQRILNDKTQLAQITGNPGGMAIGTTTTGGGGRGRGNRGGGTVAATPVSVAVPANTPTIASTLAELVAALNDPNTPDDALKAKLLAFRDAKTRVQTDLTQAQEELKTYVTLRQEAILMNLGYLD